MHDSSSSPGSSTSSGSTGIARGGWAGERGRGSRRVASRAALLAPVSLPPVLAEARAPALLAVVSLPPVLADARAPALLAAVSHPPVLADPLPRALLAVVPSVGPPVRTRRTSGPFRLPRARLLAKICKHDGVSCAERCDLRRTERGSGREKRFLGSVRDDEPTRRVCRCSIFGSSSPACTGNISTRPALESVALLVRTDAIGC